MFFGTLIAICITTVLLQIPWINYMVSVARPWLICVYHGLAIIIMIFFWHCMPTRLLAPTRLRFVFVSVDYFNQRAEEISCYGAHQMLTQKQFIFATQASIFYAFELTSYLHLHSIYISPCFTFQSNFYLNHTFTFWSSTCDCSPQALSNSNKSNRAVISCYG